VLLSPKIKIFTFWGSKMKSKPIILGALALTLISTSGCSYFAKKTKKVPSASSEMSFPPTLKKIQSRPPLKRAKSTSEKMNGQARAKVTPTIINANTNYYIVVGTYPNNDQALDMFIKMSSFGFTNTAMETRTTKQGRSLHMVRLGPFNKQIDIDKTKDTLTNAGMTQFKVVGN